MDKLQTLQLVCLTVMATLAFILFFSGFISSKRSREYERSRWLLFKMAVLMTAHFSFQLAFGFRARGADLGASVNLLFYTPVEMIIALAIMNLVSGDRIYKEIRCIGICATVLEFAIFLIGMTTGTVLRPGWWLVPQYAVFILFLTYCIIRQWQSYKRAERAIDMDHSNPVRPFFRYTFSGAWLICITGILTPFVLFKSTVLLFFAPVALMSFIYFCACFVCMEHNFKGIAETVAWLEKTEKQQAGASEESSVEKITEDKVTDKACEKKSIEEIESAIRAWREGRGYTNPDLSISTFASEIGICRRQLSAYLGGHLGCTFRSWITSVRVEEAKKIILSNPDMKAEAVAETCGFSSRSFFQTSFKNVTGMTPLEWAKMQ